MKFILGLFLIIHGIIHTGYLTPKLNDPNYPFTFNNGWFVSLVGEPAKIIGKVLAVVTIVSFLIAGSATAGLPGLESFWKYAVMIGSIASLLLIVLFWQNWLISGVLIDGVLLYGVLSLRWSIAK